MLYNPDDYGILSLSNVLKYIHDLTDIYNYPYVSESERPPITGREIDMPIISVVDV
ncbi:hypothetical protein C2G38_2188584 [Gigaspora rosea]|uniref:Uncharacterized protein n=1 Tax=Gigaspora rosea TaxID=44941 RepID=A0A397V5R6_9GLOM|nr:hypothetical protein C2G38_2188584 [Gigaspora rosea]